LTARRATASLLLPFAAAIFLGAFLLFQVQPLIGKFILPWFGGAPAVWTACMLFFQTLLLAGYAYAHFSTRLLSPRGQAVVHVLLLIAAICMLPITPAPRWQPLPGDDPTIRILALLGVCVGVPYFALSATGPLLQAWLARLSPARAPYRLYALSNVASFLALLSYPVVVEPLMTRRSQAIVWSIGLGGFAIICAACAALLFRRSTSDVNETAACGFADQAAQFAKPRAARRWLWLLLPACASLLLLAITNKICQDVAVVPLLWIVPLALYLLSFVICFDSPRWYDRRVFVPLFLAALALVCCIAFPGKEDLPIPLRVSAYAVSLFACCMLCHGELYRLRPPPAGLTAFYLLIAAGGAIGGLFVGLVSPLIFNGYTEMQVGLFLAYGLMLIVLFSDPASPLYRLRWPLVSRSLVIAAGALVPVLWVTASPHLAKARTLLRARNFYGVVTLYQVGSGRAECLLLHHGGVTHGLQLLEPQLRKHATAYYGPESGVGLALRSLAQSTGRPLHVGVVGLGAGTIAAYAAPRDFYRFYEINPLVIDLARDRFTFLSDCPGTVDVVAGDARLSLEHESAQSFDLLALDAFSGDAIPVHLLTAECFQMYLRHLAPRGIIAVHVSNKHLDLEPVLRKEAEHAGLAAVRIDAAPADPFQYESTWVLLARDAGDLNTDLIRPAVSPPSPRQRDVPLWTDDYSDLFRILK
jgi:SAM-dependent methyltransferase